MPSLALRLFVLLIFLLPFEITAATPYNGSIQGELTVSPSGGAIYKIPLDTPPGIAGMQPDLSLIYNSQKGNGLLGVGFSLGGLSTITRCPTTIEQDGFIDGIDFDANDRFCLDGQRLIAVNGTYGAAGTEYRTEVETFSRVISVGAPGTAGAHWLVYTKSGRLLEYGPTSDPRVWATTAWATLRREQTIMSFSLGRQVLLNILITTS